MAWRYPDYFFEYRTHLEQRYGAGFLPDNSTIQDWGSRTLSSSRTTPSGTRPSASAGKAGNIKGVIQQAGTIRGRARRIPRSRPTVALTATLFKQATDQASTTLSRTPTAIVRGLHQPDGQVLAMQLLRVL